MAQAATTCRSPVQCSRDTEGMDGPQKLVVGWSLQPCREDPELSPGYRDAEPCSRRRSRSLPRSVSFSDGSPLYGREEAHRVRTSNENCPRSTLYIRERPFLRQAILGVGVVGFQKIMCKRDAVSASCLQNVSPLSIAVQTKKPTISFFAASNGTSCSFWIAQPHSLANFSGQSRMSQLGR
jgi:hypothetical protein